MHRFHVKHLSDLVHGRECKEVVVLFLCDKQSGDTCALLVVIGVLLEQILNLFVVLLSELKRCVIIVILGVSVVREGRELPGRCEHG